MEKKKEMTKKEKATKKGRVFLDDKSKDTIQISIDRCGNKVSINDLFK